MTIAAKWAKSPISLKMFMLARSLGQNEEKLIEETFRIITLSQNDAKESFNSFVIVLSIIKS
jgi:hypothetical protein